MVKYKHEENSLSFVPDFGWIFISFFSFAGLRRRFELSGGKNWS